jgi:enediyne biosynthesis protein E4
MNRRSRARRRSADSLSARTEVSQRADEPSAHQVHCGSTRVPRARRDRAAAKMGVNHGLPSAAEPQPSGVTTDYTDFTDKTFSIRDIRDIRGQKIFAKTKDSFLQWYGLHGFLLAVKSAASVVRNLNRLCLFFILLHPLSGWSAAEVTKEIIRPFGPNESMMRSLEENKQRQRQAAQTWKAFHDFQFVDRWEQSGIRFEQHPVDDAAKNYKAVHYDHGTGLAVADVDGDGRLDLYFVNQVGGNQLWRNLGQGKFENITGIAGVGLEDKICVTASFADIDNDGRPDLFVTTVKMGDFLFRNLGGGKFQDITVESGLSAGRPYHSSGAVFFDFNNDGLLDLFVTHVGVYTTNDKGRGGFYRGRADAFQGWRFPSRSEPSVLYQNLGGGKFKDVSKATGLEHRGWSGDATFCDVNEDGYPDLYVLSMSGEDRFYENDHGQGFRERTAAYFGKTPWGAMGVKFFDYNLDGRMDLFVTDMHSDMTGVQIRAGDKDYSAKFEKQKSEVWCSQEWTAENLARASNCILGNAFYQNQGQGRFIEVSDKIGAETYWPWGVSVGDVNADGYEDVLVTAGMGYPLRYAINSLLLNENGQRFVDSEWVLGVEPRPRLEKEFFTLDCSGEDKKNPLCQGKTGLVTVMGSTSSRSAAVVDLDDDGDLDIVTSEWSDHPQVLLSNLSEKKPIHYLKIKLIGTVSNRDGLGATVKVHFQIENQNPNSKVVCSRYQDGKSGYLSQSSMPLYFGLGEAKQIDRIEVLWPSGKKQILTENIPLNTLLTIMEER